MQKFPYLSKGVKICQSAHHEKMFILNYPDGGFVNINSSEEVMVQVHPPDKSKFEPNYRNFAHTVAYKASGGASKNNRWQKEKIHPNLV